jgi:signal peptidase I
VGLLLAIALLAASVVSKVDRAPVPVYRVISGSMEPALAVGQLVHVDKSAYASSSPRIGEIVAFYAPAGATAVVPICGVQHSPGESCPQPTAAESNQIFMKRVAAGPGETVALVDGSVVRNEVSQDERFARPCGGGGGCNLPLQVEVPAGHWFLLGDDREHSDDSRYWGPVPKSWIIGRVVK